MKALISRGPPVAGQKQAARMNQAAPVGQVIELIIEQHLKNKNMKKLNLTGTSANGTAEATVAKADRNAVSAVAVLAEETKKDEEKQPEEKKAEEALVFEPSKIETKKQLAEEQPAPNLELMLKMVKNLSRLSNQRDKLLFTIGELESFEVQQEDDAEETSANVYQRCELSITDDKGRDFSTKNPFIIGKVTEMIKELCVGKLAEVEAEIKIPAKF